MCVEIIWAECIGEMATQFKEYSKNDFLYSGTYTNYKVDDCKRTPVDWDDLINTSCNKYEKQTITINGETYTVNQHKSINTIRIIATHFTNQSPYVFEVGADGKTLIIKGAKIAFKPLTLDEKSASKLLGYVENGKDYMLPYTFTNVLGTKYNTNNKTFEYVLDNSYNAKVNNIDKQDIRASPDLLYYDKEPYKNAIRLQKHLNRKKIFANANATLYYKFEYDSRYDKMKVVDLIRETPLTKSVRIEGKNYTFTFVKPKEDTTKEDTNYATSADDIVYDNVIFRKYNPDLDVTTNKKKKIIFPAVTTTTESVEKSESVKWSDDGTFVCDLTGLPSFQIVFNSTTGDPALRYSANAYLFDDTKSKYVKLSSFIKKDVNKIDQNSDPQCKTDKRNKELCQNKTHADNIMTKTTNHTGANQRYMDTQAFSDTSMLNIFNLGIGIVGVAVFIANTYK